MLNITGKRIAIVEDDAASLKYYETLLRETGAEVSVYRNGKEFVDAITVQAGLILILYSWIFLCRL
jgi:CheY-like chemotaxis protein